MKHLSKSWLKSSHLLIAIFVHSFGRSNSKIFCRILVFLPNVSSDSLKWHGNKWYAKLSHTALLPRLHKIWNQLLTYWLVMGGIKAPSLLVPLKTTAISHEENKRGTSSVRSITRGGRQELKYAFNVLSKSSLVPPNFHGYFCVFFKMVPAWEVLKAS